MRSARARRWIVRVLGLAFVALGLLLTTATPAMAHASLVSSDPPDGARLDESPERIQLTFSESVSADLGGVRVLDAEGQRVDEGAARVDGSVVEIGVRPDLPDGTYVVTYRIVSADGHPVRGGSVFGIGDVEVDAAALGRANAGGDDRTWEVVGAVARGLAYAGSLLAVGGILFLVLVHRDGAERRTLVRVVRLAAVVGALTGLVALPVQAALGTGQGATSLFDDGVLGEVAADGVGLGLVLGWIGLLLGAALVARAPRIAVAGALLAAASFAATGHTRAGDDAGLATVADVAHLLVVAVWGGGLVLLWLALRARRRQAADPLVTAGIVTRFSTLATVSVVLVGVTGVVLGWREVGSIDALTNTGYGKLLLVKVAAVGVVAALGTYNHLRLVPALQQGKATAALAQLRRTLSGEAIALVGVVALTSVLVVVTPAKTSAAGGPVERIIELGDTGSVQLVVAPARVGFNQIHLYTFDPDGRPADLAESVVLELELPAAGLGPIERETVRAGPAHMQLNGNDLAVAGEWSLTVRARVDRFTEATGTATVPVGR